MMKRHDGLLLAIGTPSAQEHMYVPRALHSRLAELHNLAAHAHTAAAAAHGKGDHQTAHELSRQAHEHSINAHQLSQELAAKYGKE